MTPEFNLAECERIAELIGEYCDAELVREYIQEETRDGGGLWLQDSTMQEIADWVEQGIRDSIDQRDEDNRVYMQGQGF
jgi:hypothetical protein